jgi:hypothetical protein
VRGKNTTVSKNAVGRRRLPVPSGPRFDAAPRAIGSLGASGVCPEDSLPVSPLVQAVEQPGAAAVAVAEVVVADVRPLAREPELAGAAAAVPAVVVAVPASLLSAHAVHLKVAELAVVVVESLVAAMVRA